MATLAETLGSQSTEQPNIIKTLGDSAQTAMGLATAKDEVEQKRLQTEGMQEQLDTAKYNKALGSLQTLARTRPDIARKMVPKIQENLMKAGIAVDPGVLEVMATDDEFKRKVLAASSLLSGQATDPAARSAGIAAMSDFGMFEKGLDAISDQNKLKIQESIADKRVAASQSNQVNKEVKDLSVRLGKDALPEVYAAMTDVDKMVGGINSARAKERLGKISGVDGFASALKIPFTQIAPLENAALKGDDLKLYQRVAGLRNSYLKLRSGGAVTDPEAERFLAELGQGGVRTGEQLQNGLLALMAGARAGIKNIESGYSPEAVQTYLNRGGSITSNALPGGEKSPSPAPPPAPPVDKAAALRALKGKDGKQRYSEEVIQGMLKGQ